MKSNVRYESGIVIDHLESILADLREPEYRDFARTYGEPIIEGLIQSIGGSVIIKTAFYGDDPIAVLGLAVGSDGGIPWMAMTNEAMKHPVAVTRETRELTALWKEQYGTLYNLVPAEDEEAIRLLNASGFTVREDKMIEQHGAEYYPFDTREAA
jgi:hypothetical protein